MDTTRPDTETLRLELGLRVILALFRDQDRPLSVRAYNGASARWIIRPSERIRVL